MKGTKPTAGVPHHPVITSVLYKTTGHPSAEPAEKFAAMLQARTVGHLDHVDKDALVSALVEVVLARDGFEPDAHLHNGEPCEGCRSDYCPSPETVAAAILHAVALVETVLDQARTVLSNRMSVDMAAILIPRLKGPRSV